MADVGTHLADLAPWLLFPDQAVDYRTDVNVLGGSRWPTRVDLDDFRRITGLMNIPGELASLRDGTGLRYWGNGSAAVRIRNHIVRLTTRWGVRPDGPHGDTHCAVARGSRSTVTVRHEPDIGLGPHVFVTPASGARLDVVRACGRCHRLVDRGYDVHIPIPDHARTGHESHFAKVLNEFILHFRARVGIPSWERPNLLAKYFITTRAVELARS
jgi:hypothetical protein